MLQAAALPTTHIARRRARGCRVPRMLRCFRRRRLVLVTALRRRAPPHAIGSRTLVKTSRHAHGMSTQTATASGHGRTKTLMKSFLCQPELTHERDVNAAGRVLAGERARPDGADDRIGAGRQVERRQVCAGFVQHPFSPLLHRRQQRVARRVPAEHLRLPEDFGMNRGLTRIGMNHRIGTDQTDGHG